MGLSKTDYMRGIQCSKMLWLDKHKPELRKISDDVKRRLDRGNDFGDRAMDMFAPFEEMTTYLPNTEIPDIKAMLQKTTEHLSLGTSVICEAAFNYYYNYCAVDILRKTDTGYDIYEVKDSPVVDEIYVKDAGFQHYILKRCGIEVGEIYIVTHGDDEASPFVLNKVTAQAKSYESWIDDNIWNLNRMQKQENEIEISCGIQCREPYECWYFDYCHQTE